MEKNYLTIINLFQALIDGPAHGVKRQSLQFSRMSLLDYKIKIPRSAREKTIKKGIDYNLSLSFSLSLTQAAYCSIECI